MLTATTLLHTVQPVNTLTWTKTLETFRLFLSPAYSHVQLHHESKSMHLSGWMPSLTYNYYNEPYDSSYKV